MTSYQWLNGILRCQLTIMVYLVFAPSFRLNWSFSIGFFLSSWFVLKSVNYVFSLVFIHWFTTLSISIDINGFHDFTWQIFLKINPIHAFTITDNFPKFRVYRSTNVGAIQATAYYDKNLTKSPSKKVISLTEFFENQSHPLLATCISINKCRRYPGDNILWHMKDGRTDWRVENIILTQLCCVGYN
jgi:hypothetical protein